MRKIIPLNHGWQFTKTPFTALCSSHPVWENVSLPHTWNAIDGADGSSYYRGECCYRTILHPGALLSDASLCCGRILLRIPALSLRGEVYADGKPIGSHEGGYSAFVTDLTRDFLEAAKKNVPLELIITADNLNHSNIYPQMADFTFYGGLYRGVQLLLLPSAHFEDAPYAAGGLTVSSELTECMREAILYIHSHVNTEDEDYTIRYQIIDREGNIAAESWRPACDPRTEIYLPSPHLWQGVEDPYLYRCTATLIRRNEMTDQISTTFGIRDFYVDSEKGFFLNDKPMMLRGVSRHQDWLYEGYALTREQHFTDASLISEIGANTVRLAHYQHSEDFYDACDEYGFIVWAEIPYISTQSADPAAHENAMNQMKELIYQNYNHPSICFWGISNEITIGGEKKNVVENHKELHRLVKEIDPSRLTTMAHVSMLPMDSALHGITDLESYNHYFGWYGGNYNYNEKWLDAFHEKHPDICLGLSEYGAEGIITYQPDNPKCRDYSEAYQALYHEHMVQILMERPYLWSTHVWNMFDFGCAARNEGGVAGRNNKGLVTMDRQIKKDAFYVYKAYWSKTPFVYLCGRRYARRAADTTTVKIYSNQPQVSLYVNGTLFATKTGSRIFLFENVPLMGEFTFLTAKAENCSDNITLEKVAHKPDIYTLPMEEDAGSVANWFEQVETIASDAPMEFSSNHFSVQDKISDILSSKEAFAVLSGALSSMTGMKLNKSMLSMMQDCTPAELSDMFLSMGNTEIPVNAMQIINAELSKISK